MTEITSRTYFLGLETEEFHSPNWQPASRPAWEKDSSLDNYGLNEEENDFVEKI